jgi:3',5'-cyclic AMP phosphodiesterase CpdA
MSTDSTGGPSGPQMTRRQLLRHTAWFGTAVALTVVGGEVISHVVGGSSSAAAADPAALNFVQVSDSHIGFTGPANADVTGSFGEAIDQINKLSVRPDFVMHTGDLTHLSTPAQFDQVKQMMTGIKAGGVFTVPGEHDSVDDHGEKYRAAFGSGTQGNGWYSMDVKGVHVIALVNSLNLEKLGHLGQDQIDWVTKDLAGLSADTPIVVFSHIPLFAMYPDWGWGTDDAEQVIGLMRRFSSVTALNGHVHQVFSKTDGNVTFHSATTTAYPLPHPGDGPAPTPQTLPAGKLKSALGIREVTFKSGGHGPAVVDQPLL